MAVPIQHSVKHFSINSSMWGMGNFLIFSLLVSPVQAESSPIPDWVFVQVPLSTETADNTHKETVSLPFGNYVDGCRIVRYKSTAPQTEPVNLTPDFASACDPTISFDGKTILFAGKKQAGDVWQIWRMDRDGANPVQLTQQQNHCVSPLYVGTLFFLNDPAPTEQIVFVGIAHERMNENGNEFASSLYGCDLEGKNIHRITYNINSDFSPDVLPNGRIIFSSKRNPEVGSEEREFSPIMAVSNDGTDLLLYFEKSGEPRLKIGIRAADTERVYFIESLLTNGLGGGDLAYVSMHRPLHSYHKLAEGGTGFYHYPCPLPDGELLASYREKTPDSTFSLYRIDPENGQRRECVYSHKAWHCLDTQVLAPHAPVHGRASIVEFEKKTGIFYCLNSYISDYGKGNSFVPDSIKRLRIIEGIPLRKGQSLSQFSATPFGPRRLLGEIPVEADGSFQVEVPAQIPLLFQVVDENGIALAAQKSWTWVMPKENHGCIGCHEDPELSPPNRLAEALKKPAHRLTLSPEKRRIVDFRNTLAPMVQSKCSGIECHSPGGKPPNLDVFEMSEWNRSGVKYARAYLSLLFPKAGESAYVVPGDAGKSPLIQLLLKTAAASASPSMCMPKERALSSRERRQFIEWVDLGAQWDCSTEAEASSTTPTGK